MPSAISSPCRWRMFTLIELLVVIAIVAILASILLPALTAAKAEGRRVSCITRLKNMAMAVQFYQADSDGWYPVNDIWNGATPWPDPSPGRYRFGHLVRPYLQPVKYDAAASVSENMFWCPAAGYEPGMTTAQLLTVGWAYGTVGNYWNSVHFGYGYQTGGPYFPQREVPGSASTYIMVGELSGLLSSRFGYVTNGTANSAFFHTGRTNMLLADGHVGTYRQTGIGGRSVDLKGNGIRFR